MSSYRGRILLFLQEIQDPFAESFLPFTPSSIPGEHIAFGNLALYYQAGYRREAFETAALYKPG